MTNSEFESLEFNSSDLEIWSKTRRESNNWPVVYTLFDDSFIYVGETTNASSRLGQHLKTEKKELKSARVIINPEFNKSVCLDLESHLIRYFGADPARKLLNGNGGISDADYYKREEYREKFDEIFEELYRQGLLTRSVKEIINSDLFKYSPFKALNLEQATAVNEVLELLDSDLKSNNSETIVIQGDPGTGKTIVAIYLMKLLADIKLGNADDVIDGESIFSDYFLEGYEHLRDLEIGLVIPQQSLRKTIQKVFSMVPGLDPKNVLGAFDVAKSDRHFDLLIVDEAHRLQQRSNQAAANLNTLYKELNVKLFGYDGGEITQLDWIKKQSKHQVLLLDSAQTVKPADLDQAVTRQLVATASQDQRLIRLLSQMRLLGGEDYIEYVAAVFNGDNPSPRHAFGEYDLRFFDDFSEMHALIHKLDKEFTLSRLVAGYGWKWISKGGKKLFDFEIQGEQLTWNRTATDWINSPTSGQEVGSIHTVQGYDLNYAGVIVGPELSFDSQARKITFVRDNYADAKGKQNNPNKQFTDVELLEFVANVYRVLMTRGIKGTFLYVVDPKLRDYLRQFFPAA
jgi:DUF2075 family protein